MRSNPTKILGKIICKNMQKNAINVCIYHMINLLIFRQRKKCANAEAMEWLYLNKQIQNVILTNAIVIG